MCIRFLVHSRHIFLGKNLVHQTPVISIMVRLNDNGGGGGWEELGFWSWKNEKRSGFHTGVSACGGKLLLLEIRGNALLPIVSMFLHKTIIPLKSWGGEGGEGGGDLTLGGWFLNSGIKPVVKLRYLVQQI